MKKITVIAAFMVAFGFAANAGAQNWGNPAFTPGTFWGTVISSQDYSAYGVLVTGEDFTVDGKLGGVRLSSGKVTNNGTVNFLDSMTGGTFNNNVTGKVGATGFSDVAAKISGGVFNNNGTINGSVALSGSGTFVHGSGGTVGTLTQTGGTLTNNGTLNLNYASGTYGGTGSIGTLTAIGDITGKNWGSVGSLVFGDTGVLNLTITGISANGLSVSGWNGTVSSVDWTDGAINVSLGADFASSLAKLVEDDPTVSYSFAFDLSKIFGIENEKLTGGKLDFSVLAASGFGFDADGTFSHAGVPEPATLAIFGLGLVGLGMARARRRK